jgi:hypothetical protein
MAIVVMLGWWYSQGWLWVIQQIGKHLSAISHIFAVRVLLRTWLSPWKQIYSPTTFRNFFQSMIDNAVSRFIGTLVRTTMLFCAFVLAAVVVALGAAFLVIWPFIPLGIIILPILTLKGVAF